ncbi:MAG: O-antigen ligase family protein [Thermomicrobiaceae bacterium]
MNLRFDQRSNPLLGREAAMVVPVLAAATALAFLPLGTFAWIGVGVILAFALIHPKSVLFTVPAAIPLSFQPVQIGDLQFNMIEFLVAALAFGFAPRIAREAWKIRTANPEDRLRTLNLAVPDRFAAAIAILLVIAGIVSIIFMADTEYAAESLRTFRWTILFPVVYFFIAAPLIQQDREHRVLAAALFVGGATISAIIAIVDGLLGGGVQADAVTRLAGVAPHPNALALVLDRAAVPGILMAVLFRDRLSGRWLVPSTLILIVTLLTFSRGALLGIAAACVIVLVMARARYLAVVSSSIAAVFLVGVTTIAPDRTMSLLGGGSGSLRLELWTSSIEMIRDHPITGVGLDQFLYQYLPRYVTPQAWLERFTSHPHNLLLDVWLSLGIIGIGVVALTAVLIVWHVRRALDEQDRISLAAAGGILAAVVHGLVDQSYFLPELATSLWLLIILLAPESTRQEP